MKKLISLTLCLVCFSCVYSQNNGNLGKLKSAFAKERTGDSAIAYLNALEKVGNNDKEILNVLDTLFTLTPIYKFTDESWYFFDKYVNDLRSPLMMNILLDKYWANRIWGAGRINSKLTKLTMKMIDEVYSEKATQWDNELLKKYLLLLGSRDCSEDNEIGLSALMLKLKLDNDYSYAISVLQFAVQNYGANEWALSLQRMMTRAALLSSNPKEDKPRVSEYLDREAINHYIAADKYKKMAESITL